MNERLLLVAADLAKALRAKLRAAGYRIDCFDCGGDAIRHAEASRPDAAIIDLAIPASGLDGVDTAVELGRLGVPVVLLATAADDIESAAGGTSAGFVVKPVDDGQLRLAIRAALARRRRIGPVPNLPELKTSHGVDLTESLFDSINEGVLVTDVHGTVLYGNPSANRIFDEPRHRPVEDWYREWEFLRPDQRTPFSIAELPAQVAARGESVDDMEIFLRRRGAREGIFLNVHARPLLGSDGTPAGAVSVLRDISDARRAQNDLEDALAKYHEQNELMQTVFDSISDGLVVVDSDGDYLIFNRSARRIMGKYVPDAKLEQRSGAYGMYLPDETTPYPAADLPLVRALRNESTDAMDVFVRNEERPQGVHISVSGRPLRNKAGDAFGATIVFRDVTEIRRARLELERTAHMLHEHRQTTDAVFESMADGVLVFDTQGALLFANHSADQMVGRGMLANPDPTRWKEGEGIFADDETTRVPVDQLPHTRAVNGEHVGGMRLFVRNRRKPDGCHLSVDSRPMYDRTGQLSGAVMVARDQTASHRVDRALTNAFAHGRLEVLDTIVHNIGNAVNSVSIGVTTLRDQVEDNVLLRRFSALAAAVEAHKDDWETYLATDGQGRHVLPFILALAEDFRRQNDKLVETIERVAARVSHIVEIVRTQTSAHGGAVLRTDIDVERSIASACNILRESIESRGISLTMDCTRAPEEIRVQESNFHQMIVNLIKNSVDAIDDLRRLRETGPGRIHVEAYVDGDTFAIEVADNGIGIEPGRFKEIFFPGYTTKADGTGLGLHSVANYVISSGGTIRPSSPGVGCGATMRVAWRTAAVIVDKGRDDRRLREGGTP